MANKQRGDVGFKAFGKTWKLRFSTNALCALEGVTGKGAIAVANEMNDSQSVRMSTLRAMMWAGLSDHHPEVEVQEAGEFVDELGFEEAGSKIGEAFQLAFPAADDEAEEPGKPKAAP